MADRGNNHKSTATLASHGFTDAAELRYRPRLTVCTSGREKTGKTRLCLSAPSAKDATTGREGIAYIGLDRPLEPTLVAEFTAQGKKIWQKYCNLDRSEATQADWVKTWLAVKADWEYACEIARTVILDTGDKAWELCRLARFGRVDKILPVKYGPVNNEFEQFIRLPQKHNGLNCIITHRYKKEYKAAKRAAGSDSEEKEIWTGGYERAGFGGTSYEMQICIEHYRDDTITGADKFGVRITDSALEAADLIGAAYHGAECTFMQLGMACHPTSRFEDWE